MIPDPADFSEGFRRTVWGMAEQRVDTRTVEESDRSHYEKLFRDDFSRSTWALPDDALRSVIKRALPELNAEAIGRLIEYAREERAKDPFALLQPIAAGKDGGQAQ